MVDTNIGTSENEIASVISNGRIHTGLAATSLPWRWNIENDDFQMDFDSFSKMLQLSSPIHSLEELLNLLSLADQNKLIQYMESLMQGVNQKPIKICVALGSFVASYCLVEAHPLDKPNEFKGYIQPLMTLPSGHEFSNIFQQVFDNQHHGMLITDKQTRIITCNEYFEKTTGYTLKELVGKKSNIFNSSKHGKLFFTEMWSHVHYHGYWSGLILSKRKDGKIIPQELTIQSLESTTNNTYFLGITLDLSKSLYRIAGKEFGGVELLTQLPGQQDYKRKLIEMSKHLSKEQGLLNLVINPVLREEVELDFKRDISSALSRQSGDMLAGFLGGNIFSVALRYTRSSNKPHSLTIYSAIKVLFNYLKEELDWSVYQSLAKATIGVSVLDLDADNPNKLISHALKAMYEEHSTSGSNVCFYSSALHAKLKRREKLEKIATNAIRNKTVEVYFQPIVSTQDWKVEKFEALCRFRDGNGALLNTQEMVQITEDLGLVAELDLAVGERAIQGRKHLASIFGKQIKVTINLSLRTNDSLKSTFNRVIRLLELYPDDLPYVTVELTESAYFDTTGDDSGALDSLRSKNISVAIDDFGTGYSSFAYLKDGKFDLLKIDQEFVRGVQEGSHNYHIIKMIVKLAHTLGVTVVAEGVETIQEVKILKSLNVDLLQGFYFSKPQPLKKVKPFGGYLTKIKELKQVVDVKEDTQLIREPVVISPSQSLGEVKEIFEHTDAGVLPVVNSKRCVGLIDRENYNLHLSPTVGTNIETTQDLKILKKRAHQVMRTDIYTVNHQITYHEIFNNIERDRFFPWVAVDDIGNYVGIIEHRDVLKLLAKL